MPLRLLVSAREIALPQTRTTLSDALVKRGIRRNVVTVIRGLTRGNVEAKDTTSLPDRRSKLGTLSTLKIRPLDNRWSTMYVFN